MSGNIFGNFGPFTPEHQADPYEDYQMWVGYESSQGKLQLPIAGAPSPLNQTTSEVVTTSLPYDIKVVSFLVSRHRKPPEIPSPSTSDPNEVLISSTITPMAPSLEPNGTRKYLILGEYRYALKVPVDLSKGLKMGRVAYSNELAAQSILPSDNIKKDLI